MAKKQAITIGETTFPSKKEAQEYIKAILHKYPLGTSLNESDFVFIRNLLTRHPSHKEKVGCGVRSIEIRLETEHGGKNRQFYIIRKDGTSTDFSYLNCLRGTEEASISLFKKAARSAVKNQILDFRDAYFVEHQNEEGRVLCQETGVPITKNESHVDHHPKSFDSIIADFIASESIDTNFVNYDGFDDGEQRKEFTDHKLRERFSLFHRKVACFRVVTIPVNLTKKKIL